jgi:hypothetical protein
MVSLLISLSSVLDDCLGLEQPQLAACKTNDWDCMCNQANNVLTCYNNCPNDPNAFSAQQVKVSYCNAASVYGTSASAVPTSTGTPSQPSNVSPSGAQSSDASETSSSSTPLESSDSSSASAAIPSSSSVKSEKGAATGLVIDAGSLLVAVILGMGAAI